MHEVFKPLQQALAAHDEWPTPTTRVAVVDAARHLIQAQEAQDHYIAHMAQQTLDPDQLQRLADTPGGGG